MRAGEHFLSCCLLVGRCAALLACPLPSPPGLLTLQLNCPLEPWTLMQEYIRDANAFLEEDGESADVSGAAAAAAAAAGPRGRSGSGFLFEGQLSGDEPPPRQPDLMSLLGTALGQQLAAAQAAADAQQQQEQAGGGGGAGGDSQQQQQAAAAAGPSPEVIEAIERELDAIAVQVGCGVVPASSVFGTFAKRTAAAGTRCCRCCSDRQSL